MLNDLRLVWDLPTRLFHWLLVLAIIGQYTTAKLGFTWMPWHMRLGYFMIGRNTGKETFMTKWIFFSSNLVIVFSFCLTRYFF